MFSINDSLLWREIVASTAGMAQHGKRALTKAAPVAA